jgi:hypothetical protein
MAVGILEKLAKSKKYVLQYKEEAERLMKVGEERGLKIGLELGAVQKAIQMAKAMKKDGKTTEEIMRYTGISKNQIGKL